MYHRSVVFKRKGMDFHPKKMVKRLRGSPTVSLLILFIFFFSLLILDPLNHSFSSRGCTHHLCNLTAWTVWAFSMERRQYASSFLFPCSLFFFFWIKSEHNKWSFKYTVDFWTDINRCFPAYRMSVGSEQLKFQLLTVYSLFTMSTLTKPEQSIPYATLWFSYL